MNIQGYAYTPKETETRERYRERYKEIAHLADQLNLKTRPDYTRTHFTGELTTPETQSLSELDLALIADRGNLCFGGTCTKQGNRFTGTYNTD